MTRTAPYQAAFSRGELSPRALGRVDLQQYGFGLKTCVNAVIAPRGEFEKRPGTLFITNTKENGEICLIPFQVSDQVAYIIEAGSHYFRFFTHHLPVTTTDGGILELSSPYTFEEIKDISWTQSVDVLYLTHPNHPPLCMKRQANKSFVLNEVDLSNGPYDSLNTDAGCLIQHDVTRQSLKFSGCTPLSQKDVGRHIRIWTGTRWVHEKVYKVLSSVECLYGGFGTLITEGSGVGPTPDWQMGAFYEGSYPAHVVFHEDRLVFANTKNYPQTFWTSKSASYHDFRPTDDDGKIEKHSAIRGTLNDRERNAIQWLLSVDNQLLIGTSSGPWAISAGVDYSGLTPGSMRMHRQSTAASSAVRPLLAGPSVIFAHRSKRKLLALDPDREFGRFTSPDLNLLADHILDEGVNTIIFQEEPYGIVWCLLENGHLAGMTYNPLQGLRAWHRHEIAGSAAGPAKVESIATIPAPARTTGVSTGDDLWLVVSRTVNGKTERYIEYLSSFWSYGSKTQEAVFVDCASRYEGNSVSTITDLGRLEGEKVAILADGWLDKINEVSNRQTDLTRPAEKVIVGLPYVTEGEILDLATGSVNGTSVSKSRHLYEVFVKVWRSLGFWAGADNDHLKEFQFRNRESPSETFVEVETMDLRIMRDHGGWERTTRFKWVHDYPLPLVILSLSLRLATSDG